MGWEDDWYMFWYEEVYEGNEYNPPDSDDNNDTDKSDRKISDYKYYCRQARTCSIKGDHSTAIKFYKEALKHTTKKWDVFFAIAGEYEEIGDYASAEFYWNKCRETEDVGGSYGALASIAERADFLYRQDRLEEATEVYEKALDVIKAIENNRMGLDNLKICARAVHHIIYSYLWFGKNNPEEKYHKELKHAIDKYISTASFYSDEEIAHSLSKIAWELHTDEILTDEALILIDSAIKLNPNPPAAYYNIKAIMLQKKHQYEEALKYYNKALSKDRFDEILLNNKAECIKEELDDKILHNEIEPRDLDMINKALEILPEGYDNRSYLFTKAGVLGLLGDGVKERIIKARLVKNYDEADKAEKQLEKLKPTGTYINITGTQYYKHFEPFKEGTVVDLIKEPGNPHDKNAIRVEVNGETVGYVANSKYTLIKEVKSATNIKNNLSTQAEVQFILFNEWVIAKLI
jgi:tetratricopeptide (TPR) repeat protein